MDIEIKPWIKCLIHIITATKKEYCIYMINFLILFYDIFLNALEYTSL